MTDLFQNPHSAAPQPDDTRGTAKLHRARIFLHCVDCGHEWPMQTAPITIDRDGMVLLRDKATVACPRCALETRQPVRRVG